MFLEICKIPYLRSRGEISHTQNTCEATGGSERFSAMIVFIVPAMVFLPSSRLSRRPDFSTKKTATVNATHTKKKKKKDREVLLNVHVQLHVLAFVPDHSCK